MREDFLHYLWKFKRFDTSNLYTVKREKVTILHSGNYLQLSGPDFFNAQLLIDNQKWAGNIEIHLKSSDWYAHRHESDHAYDNVILHVVWEHDIGVFRSNNTEIQLLELKYYVSPFVVERFQSLTAIRSWIYCEKLLGNIDGFLLKNWQERLYFERLQKKVAPLVELLRETKQDWEVVLFCLLAKNFGLNTNGEAFFQIARQIPFSVIRKESDDPKRIEALLFGFANLLTSEGEDQYYHQLQQCFESMMQKYQLDSPVPLSVEFFKHRPDNFPTIRLSQLAALYSSTQNLFSKVLTAGSPRELYSLFDVSASKYWETHYQFDRGSPAKKKRLTKGFIDLIIVNSVVPLQFVYADFHGRDTAADLVSLLSGIKPESNAIIDKFATHGFRCDNVLESQGLLQLKNEYCVRGKCLDCAIGISLLKDSKIG